MDIRIEPGTYWGKVNLPPSKFEMHCKIVIGTIAKAGRIEGSDDCEETKVTFDAAYPLVRKYLEGREPEYRPMRFKDCKESLSLVLPLCGINEKKYKIEADDALSPLLSCLKEDLSSHGLIFEKEAFPLCVSGKLSAGDYSIGDSLPTDYLCGLLMTLPLLEGDSTLTIQGNPKEKSKIDICLSALADFNIQIGGSFGAWTIKGGQSPLLPELPKKAYEYANPNYKHKFKKHQNPTSPGLGISFEKDWAVAANYIVANRLGSDVQIDGLSNDSHQPEKRIIEDLQNMGGTIDLGETSSLLPILTVAAAGAKGSTALRCTDAERMEKTFAMLTALGGKGSLAEGVLTIEGCGKLEGGIVNPMGDDRISMAASIAAQISEKTVTILGADCVSKSCLNYFIDSTWLGAKMYYGV